MPIHDFGSPKRPEIDETPTIRIPARIEPVKDRQQDITKSPDKPKPVETTKPTNKIKENKIEATHPLIHGMLNIEEEEL